MILNDLPLINDDIEVLKSRNYENDFLVIMNLLLYQLDASLSLFITLLKIVSLLPPDDFHELMNKYHDFNFVLALTSDTSGDNNCAHL